MPVRLGASVEDARAIVLEAANGVAGAGGLDIRVSVGEITDKAVWLTTTALAPLDADVTSIASEIRERALAALGSAGLLPA